MQNMTQFHELSTWRTNDIVIKPYEVYTLDFIDTKPNQFIVQNPNLAELFIGLANIPTEFNYEFKVGYNASVPLGRPTSTGKMYVLNGSSVEVKVKVFSVYLPFDMATVAQSNINVQSANIQTDGIVRGFANGLKLPTGDNTIGKVEAGTKLEILLSQMKEAIDTNVQTHVENYFESLKTFIETQQQELYTLMHVQSIIEIPEFHNINTVYENNVLSIEYTATEEGIFVFNYLLNDSAKTCDIAVNDVELLTILPDEKISDWKVKLSVGDKLSVSGTEPMMRAQHYFIPSSLLNE